jgi:nucleoside-diphosphate-sugar epimerase
MPLTFQKAAVLGATGPTGKYLIRELAGRGIAVRAVSRDEANLARAFGDVAVEKVGADMLDGAAAQRAIEGCDLVADCIGLPMERIADHPVTARNIARAVKLRGARCVQVSSFWAYLPLRQPTVSEQHPREGGPMPVRMRREAEDILQQAGAAIVNLPDFYGPEVHTSILQRALQEAAEGKPVNWIGSAAVSREHVFVPDAMKATAELALRQEAYGERWIVPTAGPISLQQVGEIVQRHLGREIRVRTAGLFTLRLLSLFVGEIRALLPMVPHYLGPIQYDGSRLRGVLGEVPATPYKDAIPQTLDWLAGKGQTPKT